MNVGIHHIELNVKNLTDSLAFYEMLQGFFKQDSTIEVFDNAFSWKFSEFYIYVNQVQERFANINYHRKRVGLDHLAFKANSKKHVIELEKYLLDNNIPILYKADNYGPNYFAVYFEDPDRFKLEFGFDVK